MHSFATALEGPWAAKPSSGERRDNGRRSPSFARSYCGEVVTVVDMIGWISDRVSGYAHTLDVIDHAGRHQRPDEVIVAACERQPAAFFFLVEVRKRRGVVRGRGLVCLQGSFDLRAVCTLGADVRHAKRQYSRFIGNGSTSAEQRQHKFRRGKIQLRTFPKERRRKRAANIVGGRREHTMGMGVSMNQSSAKRRRST